MQTSAVYVAYPARFNASFGAMLTAISIAMLLMSCGESRPELPEDLRSGHVITFQMLAEADVAALRSANAGETFSLPLPGGAVSQLQVDRRMSVMPGVVSLSGGASRVPAPDETGDASPGTWAFSYTPDQLSGTMTFGSLVFEVGTSRATGTTWVVQVDPAKYDILPGSEPLEAPRQGPETLN
jgi:hypothetical protein